MLGGKVSVPTLTGTVVLRVPEGTQHDDKQVMRNKGIVKVGRLEVLRVIRDDKVIY